MRLAGAEGSIWQTHGRATGSLRNIGTLLKVLPHCRLAPRHYLRMLRRDSGYSGRIRQVHFPVETFQQI
jgi:hypothetical protein